MTGRFNRYDTVSLTALAVIGLIATASTAASAKGGGLLHLFGPFDTKSLPVSRAGIPMPAVSPSRSLGNCGRGRYRDLKTQRCRGPADFNNPDN